MEIKRTDASRLTVTEQASKQAEFTQDVVNFRKVQENAKAKQQDQMTEALTDTLDHLLGHPLGPDLPNTDVFRPDHNNSSEGTNTATPIPTSDAVEKQKLFNHLRSQFNKPPEISSDAIDKQTKFTEAVSNFKEIQERAKEHAIDREAEAVLSGVLTGSYDPFDRSSGLGDPIPTTDQIRNGRSSSSETETKSKNEKPVPTAESYAKQKLFTELMASNKDLMDKK